MVDLSHRSEPQNGASDMPNSDDGRGGHCAVLSSDSVAHHQFEFFLGGASRVARSSAPLDPSSVRAHFDANRRAYTPPPILDESRRVSPPAAVYFRGGERPLPPLALQRSAPADIQTDAGMVENEALVDHNHLPALSRSRSFAFAAERRALALQARREADRIYAELGLHTSGRSSPIFGAPPAHSPDTGQQYSPLPDVTEFASADARVAHACDHLANFDTAESAPSRGRISPPPHIFEQGGHVSQGACVVHTPVALAPAACPAACPAAALAIAPSPPASTAATTVAIATANAATATAEAAAAAIATAAATVDSPPTGTARADSPAMTIATMQAQMEQMAIMMSQMQQSIVAMEAAKIDSERDASPASTRSEIGQERSASFNELQRSTSMPRRPANPSRPALQRTTSMPRSGLVRTTSLPQSLPSGPAVGKSVRAPTVAVGKSVSSAVSAVQGAAELARQLSFRKKKARAESGKARQSAAYTIFFGPSEADTKAGPSSSAPEERQSPVSVIAL